VKRESAGVLLYRRTSGALEVLLAHPGGPFWAKKDEHAWSIPKGEIAPGESPLAAAMREFFEEVGASPQGDPVSLGTVRQAGDKIVHAWAVEQDFDPRLLRSNTFELEWPPHSGKLRSFPEVDRVAWFGLKEAERKMLAALWTFVERLRMSLDDVTKR
jgi:predicted NUDIX family NTP pyrophosphohydrolase